MPRRPAPQAELGQLVERDERQTALRERDVDQLVVRRGAGEQSDAAEIYGVTPKLMQWRINATGAHKRIQRSRDYRRQRSVG